MFTVKLTVLAPLITGAMVGIANAFEECATPLDCCIPVTFCTSEVKLCPDEPVRMLQAACFCLVEMFSY